MQRFEGASGNEQPRILLVDDQATNLRALESVLEFAGYQDIVSLNDSREVLKTVQTVHPDLILLDLHMPHLDGITVLQQLRSTIHDDFLPVLVLTGDTSSESRDRALACGANDFLSKPLRHTEVGLRVGNLLNARWLHRRLREQNESLARANQSLRETQSQLVQSEKMASLGQLVAGIAHEINNPLAFLLNNIFVVQESLERLETEFQPASPEALARLQKAKRRVSDMQAGGERVRDLVSKLRTFSRLDEGKFLTADMQETIESVLLLLRHKWEDRIEIVTRYEAPPALECYAGELNQVIMNLVANAIDAIPEQGTITLATKHEDDHFVLSVSDTGLGIPDDVRGRIFDPFFTTKPIGQGTGLGLAISYRIVHAHNGTIECSSRVGEGSTFVLRIPLSLSAKVNPA